MRDWGYNAPIPVTQQQGISQRKNAAHYTFCRMRSRKYSTGPIKEIGSRKQKSLSSNFSTLNRIAKIVQISIEKTIATFF